jgi:hypothetical protein
VWDDKAGAWDYVLTMHYDLMVRECSGCEAPYLVVSAMRKVDNNWKMQKVYKKSCECGLWLNSRNNGDYTTECPDGSLFVFEEEEL